MREPFGRIFHPEKLCKDSKMRSSTYGLRESLQTIKACRQFIHPANRCFFRNLTFYL